MNFENKVAIVTGGRRGIGRAIAEMLAQQGANIVLGDRQEDEAIEAAREIASATGRRIEPCYVDVAELESAEGMVKSA